MPLTLLVFGATGSTGKRVLESALAKGARVVALVRNPAKVPEHLRARLTVLTGDLNDAAAVSNAVKTAKPDAIIDASSALPFTAKKGEPPNSADRLGMLTTIVETLEAEKRIQDCYLILVGGVLVPEPGGKINSWWYSSVAWIAKQLMPDLVLQGEKSVTFLFDETPPSLKFTMVRMGAMVEAPTKGVLKGEAVDDNVQRGSCSFCDVGVALVDLALDGAKPSSWSRKAMFYNYVK